MVRIVGCCILFARSHIGLNPQSTIFLEYQGILLIVGSIRRQTVAVSLEYFAEVSLSIVEKDRKEVNRHDDDVA